MFNQYIFGVGGLVSVISEALPAKNRRVILIFLLLSINRLIWKEQEGDCYGLNYISPKIHVLKS